jgi:hypothetical protein
MYYKITFNKDEELAKKELLYSFMILEDEHKTIRGESRQISLHCKYDFDKERQKFYDEDIDIYLYVDEVNENVENFISKWGFDKTEAPAVDLKHILGNYNMSIKAIDGFIV